MTQVRMNLGCGPVAIPGYINVDVVEHPGVDKVFDLRDLDQHVTEDTVHEYYMRHVLEHFYPEEARSILSQMFKTLRPGGVVNVIVPNLEFHAKQLINICVCDTVENQRDHFFKSVFGWRDPKRGGNAWDAHHWGYDEQELRTFLIEAGFVLVQRVSIVHVRPHHLWMRGFKPKEGMANETDPGDLVEFRNRDDAPDDDCVGS